MVTHPDILARMPAPPAVQTRWIPIYLEPMPQCGERLNIAVAVQATGGEYHLLRTLSADKARCLYGQKSPAIMRLVDLVMASLDTHLQGGMPLQLWRPPLRDAVFIGPLSTALGDSVQDAAESSALLASSITAAHTDMHTERPSTIEDHAPLVDEWLRQVRAATTRNHPAFANRFQRKVALRPGAPPTVVGYLGDRLAAQFGKLTPGRSLTTGRIRARAYITELQMLRESTSAALIRPIRHEIMLWVPNRDAPEYTPAQHDDAQGAFAELEAFGDAHELRVMAMHDSEAAARRILAAEGIG